MLEEEAHLVAERAGPLPVHDAEAAELARRPVYHTVLRGEALELIARQYNVTVEDLQAWNDLPTPQIRAGQSLLVKPRT